MWPVFEAYKEIDVRIPIDLRENYSSTLFSVKILLRYHESL
jgi:hypothetical protein